MYSPWNCFILHLLNSNVLTQLGKSIMFDQCAKRAEEMSANLKPHKYSVRYKIAGAPKFTFVEAKNQDEAKRIFETQYPTAKILFINP